MKCECFPKVIKGYNYNESVDWFSYGVVLFEMFEGNLPFYGRNEKEMFKKITQDPMKVMKTAKADSPVVQCVSQVRKRSLVCVLFESLISILGSYMTFVLFKGLVCS